MRFKTEDCIGKKFNRLLVLKIAYKKNNSPYVLCRCDCGKEKVIKLYPITSNIIKSCGCYNRELAIALGKNTYKHNMSKTRLYKIWSKMKERCYYKKDVRKYAYYGGRGITVCDEWKNDFVTFKEWALKNGYQDNLSIDRIDVNGNYEPSNCRWITMAEQQRNRRNNKTRRFGKASR